MTSVTFARPRHTYQSYADYWRLVELAGYPVIYIDQIDPQSDACYIFSTPDTHWHSGVERTGWPNARAKIIYYSLEWYLDVDYHHIPGIAEVWTPDKWYADKFGLRYVPMGSDERLNPSGIYDLDMRYDVATLWAPSNRRYDAQGQFYNNAIIQAPNGWDGEREFILQHSKAMVCVHQHDNLPVLAPQRWCLAAAYSLPVITETLGDCGIFTEGYRLMCDLPYLGQFVKTWVLLENANLLRNFGHALHQLLCKEYTFQRAIEAAV